VELFNHASRDLVSSKTFWFQRMCTNCTPCCSNE
jgi:hypothetical protein